LSIAQLIMTATPKAAASVIRSCFQRMRSHRSS
jgi:hypothetical protein